MFLDRPRPGTRLLIAHERERAASGAVTRGASRVENSRDFPVPGHIRGDVVGMRDEGDDHDDDRAQSHDSSHRWLRMIREVARYVLGMRSGLLFLCVRHEHTLAGSLDEAASELRTRHQALFIAAEYAIPASGDNVVDVVQDRGWQDAQQGCRLPGPP